MCGLAISHKPKHFSFSPNTKQYRTSQALLTCAVLIRCLATWILEPHSGIVIAGVVYEEAIQTLTFSGSLFIHLSVGRTWLAGGVLTGTILTRWTSYIENFEKATYCVFHTLTNTLCLSVLISKSTLVSASHVHNVLLSFYRHCILNTTDINIC